MHDKGHAHTVKSNWYYRPAYNVVMHNNKMTSP